jgi:ABC-type Fe3+/spermidine/putrescine transport system ATPase subunit
MSDRQTMIELKNIIKKYGEVIAVKGINLAIKKGELVTLLGASGCGKTTTLKCVTGQHYPEEGQVYINGQDVTFLPTYKRNIGMVFQNFALFPHKTVFENVEFPLMIRKMPKVERKKQVLEALKVVYLDTHADKYPRQLSGGQQQRVSLARALVYKPEVILFDEPLSNLDAKLREEMRFEIKDLQKRMNITSIYVTHDQDEALALSDKVAIMNQGVIEQYGTPEEIYDRPKTKYVAQFIGLSNFLKGKVIEKIDRNTVWFQSGELILETSYPGGNVRNKEVEVLIRPNRVLLFSNRDDLRPNEIRGRVGKKTYLGDMIDYRIEVGEHEQIRVQIGENFEVGSNVIVNIPKGKSWLI